MQQDRKSLPCVLTIAGSDSGGGAGIQADLRTFCAYGLHGLTAITALTAQHTRGVLAVEGCSNAMMAAQLDAVFDDFDIRVVKIGMLGNATTIRCIAEVLRRHRLPPLVLDPVMVATSGARLLEADAVAALRDELFPMATVITPNLPEASMLLASPLDRADDMADAASQLRAQGAAAVLLKGGHLTEGQIIDVLDDGTNITTFRHARLQREGHGTGCTLASAIASGLALGETLPAACRRACDYVHAALAAGYQPGRGAVHVLDHFAPSALATLQAA